MGYGTVGGCLGWLTFTLLFIVAVVIVAWRLGPLPLGPWTATSTGSPAERACSASTRSAIAAVSGPEWCRRGSY